jgi:hypothetical protein
MSGFKKVSELADKFELKLKTAQTIEGEDPKSVVSDAFFGPHGEQEFNAAILNPGSNFLKVLPESVKTCHIGATVDSSAGMADFLVTCEPVANAGTVSALKAALMKDYLAVFKKTPQAKVKEAKAGVKASHPRIIQVS